MLNGVVSQWQVWCVLALYGVELSSLMWSFHSSWFLHPLWWQSFRDHVLLCQFLQWNVLFRLPLMMCDLTILNENHAIKMKNIYSYSSNRIYEMKKNINICLPVPFDVDSVNDSVMLPNESPEPCTQSSSSHDSLPPVSWSGLCGVDGCFVGGT